MSMLIVRERGHENETRPCCDSLCHQSVGLYSLVHLQLLSYVCARRRCGGSFEWEAGRAGVSFRMGMLGSSFFLSVGKARGPSLLRESDSVRHFGKPWVGAYGVE